VGLKGGDERTKRMAALEQQERRAWEESKLKSPEENAEIAGKVSACIIPVDFQTILVGSMHERDLTIWSDLGNLPHRPRQNAFPF
jgi:hypothetical protein